MDSNALLIVVTLALAVGVVLIVSANRKGGLLPIVSPSTPLGPACPGTDFVRYPDRAFMGAKKPHRTANECDCSNACRGEPTCAGYQYDSRVPPPYPNCYGSMSDGSMPLMVPSGGGVAGLRIR